MKLTLTYEIQDKVLPADVKVKLLDNCFSITINGITMQLDHADFDNTYSTEYYNKLSKDDKMKLDIIPEIKNGSRVFAKQSINSGNNYRIMLITLDEIELYSDTVVINKDEARKLLHDNKIEGNIARLYFKMTENLVF